MIYFAYVLPLMIILFWPKRPFLSLVLACCFLFVGVMTIYYFEARETFVSFDMLTSENKPGLYTFAFGRTIKPFLIGFVLFRVVHYGRRYFYKKSAFRRRANEAFE